MKRITKESLATAFQITAIIFLFSYSSSSSKVEGALDATDTIQATAKDSLLAPQEMPKRATGFGAIANYYAEKKIPGFLYTQLTMEINSKSSSNSVPLKDKPVVNENWNSTAKPLFLSVK